MTSFQGHWVISLSLYWYNTSLLTFSLPGCCRIWGCLFLGDREDSSSDQKSWRLCRKVSKNHSDSSIIISFFFKSSPGRGIPPSLRISRGLTETSHMLLTLCEEICLTFTFKEVTIRRDNNFPPLFWNTYFQDLNIFRICALNFRIFVYNYSNFRMHIIRYTTLLLLVLTLHWLQARTGDLEIGAFCPCENQTLRFENILHLSRMLVLGTGILKGLCMSLLLPSQLLNYSTHRIQLCSAVPPVISSLLSLA